MRKSAHYLRDYKKRDVRNLLEYKFDHKRRVIFEKIQGAIDVDDLIVYVRTKFSDYENNDSYSIFADVRGAIFDISDEEQESFYLVLKEFPSEIMMNRKCAFITNDPQEVVDMELFRIGMQKFTTMIFKIFTTYEAAYKWLGI